MSCAFENHPLCDDAMCEQCGSDQGEDTASDYYEYDKKDAIKRMLVGEVKKRPSIWNNQGHRNNCRRQSSFAEIAAKINATFNVNVDGKFCAQEWRKMRDQFKRNQRFVKKRKWRFADEMSFLTEDAEALKKPRPDFGTEDSKSDFTFAPETKESSVESADEFGDFEEPECSFATPLLDLDRQAMMRNAAEDPVESAILSTIERINMGLDKKKSSGSEVYGALVTSTLDTVTATSPLLAAKMKAKIAALCSEFELLSAATVEAKSTRQNFQNLLRQYE